MKVSKSTLALVVGGAFSASIAAAPVMAAENPFALKPLSSGYMVADHHGEKGAEGKCGSGKCGSEKKSDGKAEAEGKCGSEKKSDGKAEAEGKCGTGKCGAEKK
ncbi:MAG: hypothetical protein RBS75_05905 [Methylophilaceae bacterium]|jgi:uncharacterized low-complexity protein|nr:hypothetical protein [Methylophilaceae bacterium]